MQIITFEQLKNDVYEKMRLIQVALGIRLVDSIYSKYFYRQPLSSLIDVTLALIWREDLERVDRR